MSLKIFSSSNILYTVSQPNIEKRPQRLGKDEKLAKEAGITFNVKVSTIS